MTSKMKPLRLGFFSSKNYLDRNTFSGTLYYMQKALEQRNLDLIHLGNPEYPSLRKRLLDRFKRRNQLPLKIGSQPYVVKQTEFAYQVQKQLLRTPCDVIFAPVASDELSCFETNVPIIYLSDVTFQLYRAHYPIHLSERECAWKEKQEASAICKSAKVVYSSQWAADSAIRDYGADPSKVEVIPFGANLDEPPSVEQILSRKPSPICRLLFVGKDWQRKGGDIAVQTLIALNQMGIDTELTTVGTVLPPGVKHEKLHSIAFLNKNVRDQRQQLNNLFLKSDFFIFPTRAECSPIVLCEAAAFGLPAIASEVGGIPTILKSGKNGYMLPLSASGEDYANEIVQLFGDRAKYEKLRHLSREQYDCHLNWNKWAEDMHNIMAEAAGKATSAI